MRIAIVSDIHGNRTALEAVLADLRITSPDLILHGGDLADSGSSPAEIVDRVRDLGWQGVVGNTDELLFHPQLLEEFAGQSASLQPLLATIQEMAAGTREALGEERLAWLRDLSRLHVHGPIALVHASPESPWRAPTPEASDAELELVYEPLGQPIAVYACTSLLHSKCFGNARRQHRQRQSFVRRRSPRGLPPAGRIEAGHPTRGV